LAAIAQNGVLYPLSAAALAARFDKHLIDHFLALQAFV
jgi:hypothetical protein